MAAASYEMSGDKSKLYLYSDQHCKQYFFHCFLDYYWELSKEMERKDRLVKISEVSYIFKKGECASLFTVP